MISCPVLFLAALLASSVCLAPGMREWAPNSETAPPPRPCWYHMIYLVASNNLEIYLVDNMNDLVSNPNINTEKADYHAVLMVERTGHSNLQKGYTDKEIEGTPRDAHDDSNGAGKNVFAKVEPQRWRTEPGLANKFSSVESTTARRLHEPDEFKKFMDKTQSLVPDQCHTFLTLSSHGAGVFGFGEGLTLTDLANGLDGRNRLTMLGFDACLMSSYEVLQKLSHYAEFILASEETEPSYGWDWRSFEPWHTARNLGKQLIDLFMNFHEELTPKTLALVDTEQFDNFAKVET